MTYSESVYELAESYVRDNLGAFRTVGSAQQSAHELAIELQATIDSFFFWATAKTGVEKNLDSSFTKEKIGGLSHD